MTSIYQQIYDAHLDKELEVILLKLLRYNQSPKVTEPVKQFLYNYRKINQEYWSTFSQSNSFETALESYYQYSKNKCTITDTLCDHLNMTLNYEDLRDDLSLIMRDSFTF